MVRAGFQVRLGEARSWADFQALLRALHVECGSPKYDAVSARGGLPKSAVSGLIGRNPQRRPTESASVRFVSACLAHAGWSPEQVAAEVEAWRRTWRELATLEETGDHVLRPAVGAPMVQATSPAAPASRGRTGAGDAPGSRLRRLGLVVAAALVCAGVFALGAVAWRELAPAPRPAVLTTVDASARESAAPDGCTEGQARIPDARLKRTWDGVFLCENDRAMMYRWPSVDSLPTAVLRTSPSWFICWTRGQEVGGEDTWYYTQGDDPLTDPPIPSTWGFLPASEVHASVHPAISRQCTFPTEPKRH